MVTRDAVVSVGGAAALVLASLAVAADPAAAGGRVLDVERVSVGTGQADAAATLIAIDAGGRHALFSTSATNVVPGVANGITELYLRDTVTGVTSYVSGTSTGAAPNVGVAGADHDISADGRFVAFSTTANNILPGDTNGSQDAFVRDTQTGITRLITLTDADTQIPNAAGNPSISADARYVAFQSASAVIAPGDTNGVTDVYVRDTVLGTSTRVSVATGGAQGNAASTNPVISDDGRYVLFESTATDLVPGDTNGVADAFLYDRQTGTTQRVSVGPGGTQATSLVRFADLSGDGTAVAFSTASALDPSDTNGLEDVYVRDVAAGTTARVSLTPTGGQIADGSSLRPSISTDGSRVSFVSTSPALGPDPANLPDALVRDRAAGTTVLVSGVNGAAVGIAAFQTITGVSGDGTHVGFTSASAALAPGDSNGSDDAFVTDLATGVALRASIGAGTAAGSTTDPAAISANGRLVAFTSPAALGAGDTNGQPDVALRDAVSDVTTAVSVTPAGTTGAGTSVLGDMSPDGRYVAFRSSSPDLVPGDTNGTDDVFVRDVLAGTTALVSLDASGGPSNGASSEPAMDATGRYVAFTSTATDLVASDTNAVADVFVRDLLAGTTSLVSATGRVQSDGPSRQPDVSADGLTVAFTSAATNLVAGDGNGVEDVFRNGPDGMDVVSASAVAFGNGPSDEPLISGPYVVYRSSATNLAPVPPAATAQVYATLVQARETWLVSATPTGEPGNGGSTPTSVADVTSGAGPRFVTFTSTAADLVTGDTNGHSDVFVADFPTTAAMSAGSVTRVSLTSTGAEATADAVAGVVSASGGHVALVSAAPLSGEDTDSSPDVFRVGFTAVDDGVVYIMVSEPELDALMTSLAAAIPQVRVHTGDGDFVRPGCPDGAVVAPAGRQDYLDMLSGNPYTSWLGQLRPALSKGCAPDAVTVVGRVNAGG